MTEQRPEEWGERRKRREEERLRRLEAEREAAPAASSRERPVTDAAGPASAAAPSLAGAPVGGGETQAPRRALSRRELRELSAAAQADAAPATTPVDTSAAAAPPKAEPERPRSRRELRAATTEIPPVPTVVPPALTGGIRRVSADGSLGQVEPAASEVLSAEARAAALRAQAARARAEREDAARRGVERSQAQRAATQRIDAERAARDRAQRLAEELAQQGRSATSLPTGEPSVSVPIVTLEPMDPSEAAPSASRPGAGPEPVTPAVPTAPAVPSASEAERQAREHADALARERAAEIARSRAELIESERRAREDVLRAERARSSDMADGGTGGHDRVWTGPAVAAEEPLPLPRWASVPRPATGPTPTAVESAPVPVPQWSAIRRTVASGTPVGSAGTQAQGPLTGTAGGRPSSDQPVTGGSFAQVPEVPDAAEIGAAEEPGEDGPPASVYTWFHIVALAIVAFVLGLLIVMVLLQDNGQATQNTSEAVEVSVAGPHALGSHPLQSTGI